MIRGQVDPHDQAVIPLQIRRPDGGWDKLEAVVDTGFTGYLTLPLRGYRLLIDVIDGGDVLIEARP